MMIPDRGRCRDREAAEDSPSTSESEIDLLEQLTDELAGAMAESQFEKTPNAFLPRSKIDHLLSGHLRDRSCGHSSAEYVLRLMSIDPSEASGKHRALAHYILESAPIIFLIAVHVRLTFKQLHQAMTIFKANEYTDKRLPIEEWPGDRLSRYCNAHEFVLMEKQQKIKGSRVWSVNTIAEFQVKQKKFQAPLISTEKRIHQFSQCTLPFVRKVESTNRNSGAHGIVHGYEIHPAHFHDPHFQGEKPNYVVAVKAFRQSGPRAGDDWMKEVNALYRMNALERSHIVRFMTAFTRGRLENLEHYVMFEWADGGNLDNLWDEYSTPNLSVRLTKWVVKQLHGLAEALAAAHEILYRHGDLKPANILWFRGGDGHGILKIGDWGEAKGHDIATALRHDTTAKYATRRYEPPETGLQSSQDPGTRNVRSRLYDVWGLGCITLEFVIWLLYGRGGLKTFNKDNQGNYGESCMFYEPNFAKKTAKVHPTVMRYIEHMAKDPLCQQGQTALGDILDVVRTGLLVVEQSEARVSVAQTDLIDSVEALGTTPSINIIDAGLTMEPISMPDSEPQVGKGRIQAKELVAHLSQILHRRGEERYWHQALEPRPAPRDITGSSRLAAPIDPHRPRSNSASLVIPTTRRTDYSHPRLDPEDWSFHLDNGFATEMLSKLGQEEGVSPRLRPKLCDNCRNFGERLPNPMSSILFNTKTLEQNATARDCDLCCLLWATTKNNPNTQTETVEFQRVGSTLTISGRNTKNPTIVLLRNNDSTSQEIGIQIGRMELPEAGTGLHLDLIRGWLQDCDRKHKCRPSKYLSTGSLQRNELPTRVIDVGHDGASVVRLHQVRSGETGDWIALSYRWGSLPHFSTTRENLSSHVAGMDLGKMPRTFQDAIKVTRALGQRYLWIDSICIVQGGHGDFDEECKRMENVYSGAYCVLAASCATDQRSGFLLPRPERRRKGVAFCLQNGRNGTIYVCDRIENFRDDVLQGALNKRGWVLQEHALARRTIFFTEHQTYWECGDGVRCETMVKMKNESAALLGDPDFPKILDPAKHGERILRFQELYHQYSRLDLSADYDRPAAIDSLQQRLRNTMSVQAEWGVLDDRANRGLLRRSLLWYRGSDTGCLRPIHFPSGRRPAPSWSWMSVAGGIDYFTLTWRTYEWIDITSPWPRNRGTVHNNAFSGQSRTLNRSIAAIPEYKIIFDDDTYSKLPGLMAIVLAIEKAPRDITDKRHYILVVEPKASLQVDNDKIFRRVGAGYVPGRYLGRESMSCCLA